MTLMRKNRCYNCVTVYLMVGAIVVWGIVLYLIGAFIAAEWNTGEWDTAGRLIITLTWFAGCALVCTGVYKVRALLLSSRY